jgi:hypothetical protein
VAGGDPGLEAARVAKRKALRLLEKLLPVCGAGIAREGEVYVVKVNVETALDPALELPSEIDGVPIRFQVVGKVRAQ